MTITTKQITINTKGNADIVDISSEVQKIVEDSKITEGSVLIFVSGSTATVSTIEYEPGLLKDIPRILEQLIPSSQNYEHNKTWGCNNGVSHVRATLMGPNITVPFKNKKLLLGTWQQIVVIDFDTRPRARDVVIQISGE